MKINYIDDEHFNLTGTDLNNDRPSNIIAFNIEKTE